MKIDRAFLDQVKDIVANPGKHLVMTSSGPSKDFAHEYITKVIVQEMYRTAENIDRAGVRMSPKKFIESFASELEFELKKTKVVSE